MSFITLKDLVVKYPGAKEATLKGLNLEIKQGEFIVLVGPSGCGKSTTLNTLAGLEEVHSGEIIIDGKNVNDEEPKDRGIAMVFQNYALYPHMNVYKNLSFGLKNMKLEKSLIEQRVTKVAEMLGITDQLKKLPKGLSGGQQQRVAVGRAIAREPDIFAFDEPLSNLDAKLRYQTREEIVQLHKDFKKTFIYVTHDQVEAMTMADRIVVLKDGEIQQFDRPLNIFYNPVNLFVAKFMGTPEINICHLKVENGFITNGKSLSIDIKNQHNLDNKKEVYFGIRPDDIEYSIKETKGYIKVNITAREILGNQTIINSDLDGVRVNVMIKTSDYVENMETLYIKISADRGYYFDVNTEKNINV